MYKRWRHTRGYGVHSPFAYKIVKEVVRPKRDYGYYGYEEIDYVAAASPVKYSRRHARMLLRLAATLGVKSTFLPNDHRTSPFRAALMAADSGMKVTSAFADVMNCTMVATTQEYIPLDTLVSLIRTPGRVVCFREVPEGWRDRLFESLPEGLMLYGRRDMILIHRPDMAKVAYSVNI